MNEILDAIKNRRSVRKFQSTPIEDEKINNVLDGGRWAPSLGNSQPWKFIVVRDGKLKDKLVVATGHDSIAEAPISIVVTVDQGIDGIHAVEDGAVACQNMALAAHSMGLGSFWIGICSTAAEAKVRELLEIPNSYRVISILPVGYAAESPTKTRKDLEELVFHDKFGRTNQ